MSEVKEVFVLANDNAVASCGVLAKFGVRGLGKTGFKDVLANLYLSRVYKRPGRLAVGCPPGISRSLNNDVIGLICGVVDGSQDVFTFQERIIPQNFLERRSGPEKLHYVRREYVVRECRDGLRTSLLRP